MAKRKKVNPRRCPATIADVKKAQERAQSFALDAAWAIFFTALRDKEGFGVLFKGERFALCGMR